MEKYGFVYLWYDRKHKRFYIGCHWGTEDDGYICSSRWMRKAYRRRPEDFKRRIIKYVYTTRSELLSEEHRWLSMISEQELSKRYYNIRKHHCGHWSTDENRSKSISEKLKSAWTEEKRQKASKQKLGDLNPMKRPEVAESVASKNRRRIPWNKGLDVTHESIAQQGRKHSIVMKGRPPPNKGVPMSEEQKAKLSKKWKVIDPSGNETIVCNLNKYCKDNGLEGNNMRSVAHGKRKSHKGYSCALIEEV